MRMKVTMLLVVTLFAGIIVFAPVSAVWAQDSTNKLWKPTKAITLIVPSAAGGGHDIAARVFAKCAGKYAGVPINIVNQIAGGGVVAQEQLKAAKPDGLTVGQAAISLVTDQYLVKGVSYDQNSFIYIGMDSSDPGNLVVSTKGKYKDMDLKQFLAYAKAHPKEIRMGVSGSWTNHDYTRYLLEQTAGVEFTRVQVKGGNNVVLGILGGDIDAGVPYPSEVRAQVDAGNLKILAVSGEERSPFWISIPTFKEQGYDVTLTVWRALILPKGTPDNIIQGWKDIYEKTMTDPETKQAFVDVGTTLYYKNSVETIKIINDSAVVYKAIIDTGVVQP
jgi:putative tricarboxylic transport membrane protein